jgi:hypothetical protein
MPSDRTSGERLVAWASGREQRKGLRPRDAAILIIIVWFWRSRSSGSWSI